MPIKRLGLAKTETQHLQMSDTVMHAMKLMAERGISALPILPSENYGNNDDSKVLKGEFSLHSLHRIDHKTTELILGSVQHFLATTDPDKHWSSPLTCSRRDSLGSVILQMETSRKTHVWAVSKKRHVKGVVSVVDVWRLLWEHSK